MNENNTETTLSDFALQIFLIDLGILFCVIVLSFCGGFSAFIFFLLFIGMAVTFVGTYGTFSVTSNYEHYHPASDPNEIHTNMVETHNFHQKLKKNYSFENALFYAGLIAVGISLPFVCNWMFF